MTSATTSPASRLRWLAISVFVLSYGLNYLDRQLLAAVAPAVKAEFHLTNEQYGMILSVFSIVYALASPAAGLLIDRVGLNLGASLAVAAWSRFNGEADIDYAVERVAQEVERLRALSPVWAMHRRAVS